MAENARKRELRGSSSALRTRTFSWSPPGSGSASDIAIRDGQAAIEFRSYYAGTTVIEATATGLTSASVTITSQGSPAYVEGTTPKVAARPYP